MYQKCGGICGLLVLNKIYFFKYLEKNCGSCLGVTSSTANPAQFEWKWAGLAVLFKGQLISKAIYGILDSPKKRTKKI